MDKLLRTKEEIAAEGTSEVSAATFNPDENEINFSAGPDGQEITAEEMSAEDSKIESAFAKNSFAGSFPSPSSSPFANLGAPRDAWAREPGERVPSSILPETPKPFKIKIPHFKLMPSAPMFDESTSKVRLASYAGVALLVGISVMSFLTQGVLTLKDYAFGPSDRQVAAADQNADRLAMERVKTLQAEKSLADARSANGRKGGLGSDDSNGGTSADGGGLSNGGGSSTEAANLNQYSIADEASFPKLTSTSYLAADLLTGEIIYEKNEGLVAPIASVSKLMTATIALENMDMQKIAVVSRDAYNTFGAEGELLVGEKIKLYDLMHPLLMESSNDGAEVIAESYPGGHGAFMSLMNKKAADLGMNNTYYEDPSGLNPKNVSSVEDLMKLGRYIYQKHPEIFDMTHVQRYSILKHTWFNQNRFLTYDTFIGGKNGYIDESKKTTVSLFNVTMAKGGSRAVVIVLLKSDDREGDAVKLINFLKKNAYYQASGN
jgi:D-alanyl-D-alanine carboxypeptidase (penicillin-binding protein 5/6)